MPPPIQPCVHCLTALCSDPCLRGAPHGQLGQAGQLPGPVAETWLMSRSGQSVDSTPFLPGLEITRYVWSPWGGGSVGTSVGPVAGPGVLPGVGGEACACGLHRGCETFTLASAGWVMDRWLLASQQRGHGSTEGGPVAPGPALCPWGSITPTSRYTLPRVVSWAADMERAGHFLEPGLTPACLWRGLDLGTCHPGQDCSCPRCALGRALPGGRGLDLMAPPGLADTASRLPVWSLARNTGLGILHPAGGTL